jgi:hypothetical protein
VIAQDATLGREDKAAATLAPLPSSFVRASAALQPKASYWALLKNAGPGCLSRLDAI